MQARPPSKRAESLAKWMREGKEKGWKPGTPAQDPTKKVDPGAVRR